MITENGRYNAYISSEDRAVAERNGIDYCNLLNRVNELGWTVERAISEPIRVRKTRVEIYGQDIIDNLAKYNINYDTFIGRVRRGWDYVEASTTPRLTNGERGARITRQKLVTGYKGGLKQEHFDIAEKNGISKVTAYNRVNSLGWSIERAITEELHMDKCGYYTKLRNKQLAR